MEQELHNHRTTVTRTENLADLIRGIRRQKGAYAKVANRKFCLIEKVQSPAFRRNRLPQHRWRRDSEHRALATSLFATSADATRAKSGRNLNLAAGGGKGYAEGLAR